MIKLATQSGDGAVAFAEESAVITCTDALVKGELVTLTISNGKYTSCTKSVAADVLPDKCKGVAAHDVSAGRKGRILLRGAVKIRCEAGVDVGKAVQSSSTSGRVMVRGVNPNDNPSDNNFRKLLGIAMEDTQNGGDLTTILFDGINGFSSPIVNE